MGEQVRGNSSLSIKDKDMPLSLKNLKNDNPYANKKHLETSTGTLTEETDSKSIKSTRAKTQDLQSELLALNLKM